MQEEDGMAGTQPENPSIAPPPATITLSGTVSEFVSPGYDSAAVPQKGKMQWKQFFLGLFLPYAVGLFVILLFFFAEEAFDPYAFEERVIEVNEDGYFVQQFQVSSTMNLDYCYNNGPYSSNFSLSCAYDNYEDYENSWIVREYVFNQSTGENSWADIGAYSASNSTIWFKLTNSSIEDVHIALEFHDPAVDDHFFINALETSVCFLPFIYIGAVIFAFMKQKKSLGIGLLSALGVYLALLGALLVFLIFAWM
tara:strand:+ start:14158 stop:14916 length:759 start_codon:yes stop_codon:yes gene_type:complete